MNVCLIGLGKWGKKLLVALKSIKKIKFTLLDFEIHTES